MHYGKNSNIEFMSESCCEEKAEEVLSRLGVPMSIAIDMYLNQISFTGGIPFAVTLPKAPDTINADLMAEEQLHAKL